MEIRAGAPPGAGGPAVGAPDTSNRHLRRAAAAVDVVGGGGDHPPLPVEVADEEVQVHEGGDAVEAVGVLGELTPPVPAWCLADSNEIGMCNLAATAGNTVFRAIEIPKGDHGQMLLRPDLAPLPMQVILDFLTQVFE